MKGNNLLVGVMSLVLVALVVLIIVLVNQSPPPTPVDKTEDPKPASTTTPEPVVAKPDQPVEVAAVRQETKTPPPPPPKPIAKPTEIKHRLKEGKTYESTIKAGFVAKAYTQEWGIREEVNLTYLAEMQVSRKIEANDGKRIVELRHIKECRNAKLLARVENVSINLGLPGMLVLGALESWQPGTVATVTAAQPFAEAMLKGASQYHLDSKTAKAVASINSLSGKKVRIVYVDGEGVVSLEPVGCSLTESEFNYLSLTAVLSDCYIFPEVNAPVGHSWEVEASQLAGLLDPTLRGQASGVLRVTRNSDEQKNGRSLATLSMQSGTLTIDSSDKRKVQMAKFTPKGTMHFALDDGYVTDAELKGAAELFETSKDHILFKSEFSFRPQLEVQYSCTMQ
jgi:hypothetical protein